MTSSTSRSTVLSSRGKQNPIFFADSTSLGFWLVVRIGGFQAPGPAEARRGSTRLTLNSNSMAHKVYHGKTGVIYNVTKSAVGIIIYKKVKHRYLEKRLNVRIEHISPSRSRDDFIRRVKANAELKKLAKVDGKPVQLKRQPAMPRDARTISIKDNRPETVTPVAYETTI